MRLLLLLGVVFITAPALAGDEKDSPYEQQRKAILDATNEFRKANKLPPLSLNEKLTKAAQGHVANLVRHGKLGDDGKNPHTLEGKNSDDRVKDVGYEGKTVRENISLINAGANASQRAMTGWKKSPIHRRNMLATDVTEIGIGVVQSKNGKWFLCQVFASPAETSAEKPVPILLRFEVENKTNNSIEFQLSNERERRTMSPKLLVRVGTPKAVSLIVFYRKPSKEQTSITVKDGCKYVISDKDGNGRYAIEQVERRAKDAGKP